MAPDQFPASPKPSEVPPRADAPVILVPVMAQDVERRKRRIVFACVAAFLAAVAVAMFFYKHSVDPLEAQESFDSGQRLMAIGRYNQAILAFDRAIRLKPDFADAYFIRGTAYVADSKTVNAIRDFTRVIELRPRDSRAILERASAYLELKDFQSALEDTGRILAIDPKLARAYNLRGVAIRSMGAPRKALDQFNRAVELSPDMDNYYQRGATYQLLGEHRRAIADFDQVIAKDPGAPVGYFARAGSRRAIGDVAGANQDTRQAKIFEGR